MLPTTYRMRDEYTIPAPEAAFDVVLAAQVIEHVRRIWQWMPEVARVLKPAAKLVILSPISWPHHPAPYDCWRIYSDGMRALCDEAGLRTITCELNALEPRPSKRWYPGTSYGYGRSRDIVSVAKQTIERVFQLPVRTAVDMITIAEKPLTD
jgi:SAM-dependent methyltransferase